ncbi:hypothetical protein FPOA_05114 [Fusarium poae]|uniref:DUF7730 domain-containing protein n=1 Tax=Fusarium poae TaxID=36050 RepID=A0A1B8AVN8_FUSPO|nr:hypothetical protein FPOA_05114 [Fusarium poae]
MAPSSPASPDSPGYSIVSPGSPGSPVLSTIESPTSPVVEPVADWRDHIHDIPRLPSPRPRVLTPNGFRESDTNDQQMQVPILLQSCSWFKVPPHLRRDILRLAFGDRRLHMGLKFDASLSPSWHSSGMVCHRVSPDDKGPMTRGSLKDGPWVDECDSPDQDTESVGIMGWLLSCRQNYAETIDILYSMNTILIYDEPLLTHLTHLILPHRLALITSLEIKWTINTAGDLNTLIHRLSLQDFPNLKHLYISLEIHEGCEAGLTQYSINSVLADFVRNRTGLIECAVALPFRAFESIARHLIQVDSSWERKTYSQIWSPLDGGLHAVRLPYVDSYPKPPFQLGPNPGAGYWLLEGTAAPLTWRWRSSSNGWSGVFPGWEDWGENAEN